MDSVLDLVSDGTAAVYAAYPLYWALEPRYKLMPRSTAFDGVSVASSVSCCAFRNPSSDLAVATRKLPTGDHSVSQSKTKPTSVGNRPCISSFYDDDVIIMIN